MTFLELAAERYSCRKFSDKPLDEADMAVLLKAAQIAPTAKNAQPFHIWTMTSPVAVEKVRSATPCHFNAPAYVLFGAKKAEAYEREEDGYNFAVGDAVIAATHFILAAADLGINTCWVGRFDPTKINELFPETQGYELVGLFDVGYAAEDAAAGPSPRHTEAKPLEELVTSL